MSRSSTASRSSWPATVTLGWLAGNVEDATIVGDPNAQVTSIVYDSREARPGSLFVALRGGYTDGHLFIPDALDRGAMSIVVDSAFDVGSLPDGVSGVIVDDTRGALAQLAERFYGSPSRDIQLIGITGTDGKTTTAFILHHILATLGHSPGLITTVAVRVPGQHERSAHRQTTPESLTVQALLREIVDAGAKSAVLETTSHGLVTHRVDGCLFDVGIVTNVTSDHLDFHRTLERYRAAKGRLLQQVGVARHYGKRGVVVLNADDEGARTLEKFAAGTEVHWYGIEPNPSLALRAVDVYARPAALRFTLETRDKQRSPVTLPMAGTWNVYNALAAATAALGLGFALSDIAEALHTSPPVPGRMEIVRAGQPFTVIIDYAHTPTSLRGVLHAARATTDRQVMVLIGSAGERDVQKRPELGRVAIEFADYSVFTSEDPRYENPHEIIDAIASGAREAGALPGRDFVCIEDRREAIRELLSRAAPGDCIVCAGKGHERSMIYDAEHLPWNEYDAVYETLRDLGYGELTVEQAGC